MKIFKNETKRILLGNKWVDVQIIIKTQEDPVLDIDDLSKQDQDRINKGELTCCLLTVEAHLFDVVGFDVLGNVFFSGPEGINSTLKEYNMVENAVADLKHHCLTTYNALADCFEGDLNEHQA